MKKIVGMLALVALMAVSLGACKAQAAEAAGAPNFPVMHQPLPTYIWADYMHIGKVVPGSSASRNKMRWQPVYHVGVMLEHRRYIDDQGASINYCGSPRTPDYAQFMPNPPRPCEPIFVELYTVPIPKRPNIFAYPMDIQPIVEGSSTP